ncbi:MAG: replicative DNA helicase [Clostridia bacterium]|nr:replicative DNA helicase [Clostridia bacterium]
MADYRVLPSSIEAEQALLGCVLLDNEAQNEILDQVLPEDFYSEAHQRIYSAMIKIHNKSMPVDFVILTNELENEDNLNKVGGIDYITMLTNAVPSAVNYEHYMAIVKNLSIRRLLIKNGQKIIETSFKEENKDVALEFAEKAIYDLSTKEENSNLEHIGKPNGALSMVLKKFDDIARNQGEIRGIATGLKDFDAITNGLQNSDLILLAARPGVGKTSFAMNIMTYAAIHGRKKCAIFSLEMAKDQIMQRALCSVAKVSMGKALKGTMEQDEWKRIWGAEKELASSAIYIDDSSLITPSKILKKCRMLKMKEGLDIIMIDYLQLMTYGSGNRDNRVQEVADITRMLKVAAKELNVPIILLSQLSRSPETRPDHHPLLSDLRESGSIEQDADIVLFLYNPEKYNDVVLEDPPGTVELIVAKHRNGSVGTVKLRWIGETTTFTDFDEKTAYKNQKKSLLMICHKKPLSI